MIGKLKISLANCILGFVTLLSVNLSAKEKQTGYYDSLAVLKDLPSYELIQEKLKASIVLELYRKDIEQLESYRDLITKQLEEMKDTLSGDQLTAAKAEIEGVQNLIQVKQDEYLTNYKAMEQEELGFIRGSLQQAIDLIKKRLKLGKVVEVNSLNDSQKTSALDVTSQIREELFRLEKERCAER